VDFKVLKAARLKVLTWKSHITRLSKRLGSACCAIRTITSDMSTDILNMVYYAYVHSLIYGVILGGTVPILWRFSGFRKGYYNYYTVL
jgi:hypothetical protein